jgi:phosphoribosyl 1,2-cyclic phosphate phosphodiesterase
MSPSATRRTRSRLSGRSDRAGRAATNELTGAATRLRFLGTGAAGGTPGRGRSHRLESSLLVEAGVRLLIDVTRDFERQSRALERLDAVLLTHAHADACGGVAELRRWLRSRGVERLPLYAGAATIAALEERFRRLDHCDFVPIRPGRRRHLGGIELSALEVPHAREERFPTFAWRIREDRRVLVYASDVARLTPELERFSRGASLLVIDGAMWRRQLFSHLTIDRELPRLCDWRVERIVLTQIGRTAPAHERLEHETRRLCHRARPGHDGLTLKLP